MLSNTTCRLSTSSSSFSPFLRNWSYTYQHAIKYRPWYSVQWDWISHQANEDKSTNKHKKFKIQLWKGMLAQHIHYKRYNTSFKMWEQVKNWTVKSLEQESDLNYRQQKKRILEATGPKVNQLTGSAIISSSCWSSNLLCKFMSSSSNSAFCKLILSSTFSLMSWLKTSNHESSSSADFSFSGLRALSWDSLSASSLRSWLTSTWSQITHQS